MKKIIFLLFTCLFAFVALSCNKGVRENKTVEPDKITEPPVVSYNGAEIDRSMFHSKLILYKQDYINYLGLDGDSSYIWEMPADDGRTAGEIILELTLHECAVMSYVIDACRQNGIELTQSEKQYISEGIEELRESYSSDAEYLSFIEGLGLTEEEVLKNEEMLFLYEKGVDYLTSQNGGEYYVSDDMVKEYFDENYVAVKHIYVNNVAEKEDDGSYVEISEENYKKQNSRISDIEKALESGEDFDAFYAQSDDGVQEYYPDGIVLGIGDVSSKDYEEACFSLQIGEWKRVDVSNIGVYFIKRVEVSEEQESEKDDEIRYYIWSDFQDEIWKKYSEEFTIDYDYVNLFDIMSVSLG